VGGLFPCNSTQEAIRTRIRDTDEGERHHVIANSQHVTQVQQNQDQDFKTWRV